MIGAEWSTLSHDAFAADPACQNAQKNTPNAARIGHDKALAKVMLTVLTS